MPFKFKKTYSFRMRPEIAFLIFLVVYLLKYYNEKPTSEILTTIGIVLIGFIALELFKMYRSRE